ncbi:MAG: HAD-IIA family hydrolase [Planctomycetota bacterium]|jgi:NagD protein
MLEKIRNKKAFICDMDGVIFHGKRLLDGSRQFVDWLKAENKEYLFLTNSSERTPKQLSEKLAAMGIEIAEEHFMTSALATAAFLRSQKPGARVYVIGAYGLKEALSDAGCILTDEHPDYVVLGETMEYTHDKITMGVRAVLAGAKLIGTNPDISGPSEDGVVPACKALISPIELATGKQAYFIGKPNPLIMRASLKRINCHRDDAVIIGDRMDTDIIAGIESEIQTVLVLSGITTREDVEKFPYRPNLILDGVGQIPM